MRGIRLDRVLVSTALALVLAAPAFNARAQSASDAAIEARVPMPDLTDDMPPPTAADIGTVRPARTAPATVATRPSAAPAKSIDTPEIANPAPIMVPDPTTTATAPMPVSPPAPAAMTRAPDVPSAPAAVQNVPAAPSAATPPATAETPAAAPALTPVAALDAADTAVAEQLRSVISGRPFERLVTNRKERAALTDFYTSREFAPVWVENGQMSPRAKAVIARLKLADAVGLDPHEYQTPDFSIAKDAASLADAELKFASVVLTYARHAQSGRTDPARISNNIEYRLPMPEPLDVLTDVAASNDIAKTFDGFNPPQHGFAALKQKLAELRGTPDDTHPRVAQGPILRVNAKRPMKDARVPMLRERFGLQGEPGDTTYDETLAEAVKQYQQSKNISPNGRLTAATVDALNGVRKDRQVDAIIATMERWRWMPRDLGQTYVMLNIPDYSLKVVRDNNVVWRTRTVVGKPATATPIFSSAMENILVNPTWHVPESIIYNEYMPQLERDPNILARLGLEMKTNPDGSVKITQPPGPKNALGQIKFNFANRFAVYMHDTPSKSLFNRDARAFSHGCVRVQNPEKFGEVMSSLGMPGRGYSSERLASMYGKGEAWLKFTNKVPVHLTYQTAFVDDSGKLVVRNDIYGLDTRVIAALKGDDRDYGKAEVAAVIKRTPRPERTARPAAAPERRPVAIRDSGPDDFFSRLFR